MLSTRYDWLALRNPSLDQRRIFAALVLAWGPVTNRELAELMGVSPAEASKRVKACGSLLKVERHGREVLIALP
jgi:chromosome segregation and condensation protein ScpB